VVPPGGEPPVSPRRLPAEWDPQDGVLLTWPHGGGDWASRLGEVEPVFLRLAAEISAREWVLIVCADDAHRRHVRDRLEHAGANLQRIDLRVAPSNDTWARDHGPITVADGDHWLLLDFRFNGWGGKYPAQLDDCISARLHADDAFGSVALHPVDLELEGGAIDCDGAGTLLTTEACLLHGNRNPGLDRHRIEALLKRHLGVTRVLWLANGMLAGDDTDGHIDTLARFCDRHTIAHVACPDPHDVHHRPLQAMTAELARLRTSAGAPYRLVELPLPAAIHDRDGRRLPATHANFLVIDDAVLVPTYDDPSDAVALTRLQGCFPDRRVVGIDCRPLIEQFGSLHCVTMQLPRGVLKPTPVA